MYWRVSDPTPTTSFPARGVISECRPGKEANWQHCGHYRRHSQANLECTVSQVELLRYIVRTALHKLRASYGYHGEMSFQHIQDEQAMNLRIYLHVEEKP